MSLRRGAFIMQCAIHVVAQCETIRRAVDEIVASVPDCQIRFGDDPSGISLDHQTLHLLFFHVDLADPSACRELTQTLKSLPVAASHCYLFVVADNVGASPTGWLVEKELLEAGVYEIMERPLNLRRVRYVIESVRLKARTVVTRQASESPTLQIQRRVSRVAAMDTNILLSGETGVGKSHLAREIHLQSPRADQPFVVINCANISPNLAEGELFGHVKGAFTGADENKIGKFEHAGAGTIFLDELNSLPSETQAKLLRVVEERQFSPVGSVRVVPMNARIISASNVSLERLVNEGSFRSDLYFRINGYEIPVPPVRDRREEIPEFCRMFLSRFAERNPISARGFAPGVIETLVQLPWEGNLRDIRNVVEFGAIECLETEIQLSDLPFRIQQQIKVIDNSRDLSLPTSHHSWDIQNMPAEKATLMLKQALVRNNNNRAKTARELGVSRMTIYNWLKRLQVH